MVGSEESVAPGVFTHPPVLESSSLYTYSSPPRPLHGNQGRTRKYRNKVLRPRGIHDYFNIMWDPHIRRGNTGITKVAQADELEPKSSNETSGKGFRKKRSYNQAKSRYRVQTNCRTPPPVEGRLHNLVQTETYLEDLSCDLSVTEADVNIQTDLMLDEPVSPDPIPMKTGIDASTQVLPGELSDFDDDVQPIVTTLVAKILEQSLMETMEEEELIALKEQQNRFEEKKREEERQLKLLQEQHERITAERERLKRHLESQNIHTCAQDQVSFQRGSSSGGPVYSTEYLLELLPSVLDSLRQEGFLSDNITDALLPNMSSKPDNGESQEGNSSDAEGAIKENGMRTPADLKHEGEPWNALETLEKQLLAAETMENEKMNIRVRDREIPARNHASSFQSPPFPSRLFDDIKRVLLQITENIQACHPNPNKSYCWSSCAGMPLVHRAVVPVKLSATKLQLNKNDSEFVAVNNGTLVNVLRQLASLVTQANGIFSGVAVLTEKVGKRVRSVKLRLDELEAKAELFDPKLVPVPEGSLDEPKVSHTIRGVVLEADLFSRVSRPTFLIRLYDKAGKHEPRFPPRSPVVLTTTTTERRSAIEGRRPASFAALREWKLDDYLDSRIATLDAKKLSSVDDVQRIVSSTFPSQTVQVDVTGKGFDRMKANRRSLVIHTKKIRVKKRRNTICGTMPNKECGIQTSFSSVASPSDNKKYGIDSGHWSSCTSSAQGGVGAPSSSSAPSPWDPNSLSTSSDFLFDDEDRSLTPQLENFTDGMVSDSDSVDTEGYFTSFRNECGFPKSKKSGKEKEEMVVVPTTENEYELFGKGSTSTTASSCGTVVLRNKPEPPARTSSVENMLEKKSQSEDAGWEERVKRKSLIERVPSLVVITPSPSCSSGSPPPLKDPGSVLDHDESDSGRQTPLADFSNDSESCTLSDADSDRPEVKLSDIPRPSSTNSTASSNNSSRTLTSCPTNLPQPDVIPDVQVIRTMPVSKLDIGKEYYALDTVLLGSSEEDHHDCNGSEAKMNLSPAVSSKVRGARVVLDANGEIIFSSETLRRKRRHKVSFDPGDAVKEQEYGSTSNYARIRESVYERIRKDTNEKLYECIEEIRRHNLKASDASFQQRSSMCTSPDPSVNFHKNNLSPTSPAGIRERAKINVLLETDLDSAIPPVMPELKTLPKIKDRLKRNESYRIATDEIPPRPPLHSLNNKRMSLPQNNKKRDIPEEDPVFIQQILNMSSNSHCNSSRSPTESLNRITLSKFALSPDDRPSFLRRDSPPTMDDISKEIYRFRKKFNIQPSSTSTSPTSSTSLSAPASSKPSSLLPPFPSIARLKQPLTSTPVKRSNSASPFSRNHEPNKTRQALPSVPVRSFSNSSNVNINNNSIRVFRSTPSTPNTKPGAIMPSPIQSSSLRLGRPVTSLGDFKRLLQATQRKRSTISAMEILKPRFGLETTI